MITITLTMEDKDKGPGQYRTPRRSEAQSGPERFPECKNCVWEFGSLGLNRQPFSFGLVISLPPSNKAQHEPRHPELIEPLSPPLPLALFLMLYPIRV